MTLRGVLNLQKFIEDGGLFVPITSVSQIPIDYGITSGVTIQESRQLQARAWSAALAAATLAAHATLASRKRTAI